MIQNDGDRLLLPTFHAPEWVMQVLVLILAAGFVATLVFSWVFELTPEGLKRESQIDRGESRENDTDPFIEDPAAQARAVGRRRPCRVFPVSV